MERDRQRSSEGRCKLTSELCDKCGESADVVHALSSADGKYDRAKYGDLLCTKCWKAKKYFCVNCGKEAPWGHNYCDWDCHVDAARKNGYVEYLPNGLPIRCLNAQGLMLEHEHGDHPDYVFPVDVDFVGEIDDGDREEYREIFDKVSPTDENIRVYKGEDHALIYTDGSIAVTIYECCYYLWIVRDGTCRGAPEWMRLNEWKLSEQSRLRIVQYSQQHVDLLRVH